MFHILQAQIKIRCPLTESLIFFSTCKKCCFHIGHIDKNGDLDLIEINCRFKRKKKDARIYY